MLFPFFHFCNNKNIFFLLLFLIVFQKLIPFVSTAVVIIISPDSQIVNCCFDVKMHKFSFHFFTSKIVTFELTEYFCCAILLEQQQRPIYFVTFQSSL